MDRTDELLAELLTGPADGWREALDRLCHAQAEHADELRRRFALLESCGVADPPDQPLPTAPPDRCGPYRLRRRLGSGGMGVVWLGVHESLGREVAIKMLRPERLWFDQAHERFRREVAAVARLSHPGCVQILQVGDAAGVPWFAMEYLSGASCEQVLASMRARAGDADPTRLGGADLVEALRQRGAVVESTSSELFAGPWTRVAIRIALAACDALAHAHARGIVHRDLKPGNLMVTATGRVVVVDFGLAIAAGNPSITRTGGLLGSVPYMAPEQLQGSTDLDERTDVYALGACLYELLALRPPFQAADESGLRAAILAGDCAPLREGNDQARGDLEVVVARAMHVDRARRYPSAHAFGADLQSVLADRPIQARRDPAITRVLRWTRRHPAFATATLLLLLLATLVPAAISLAIADQRDRALTAERQARAGEYGSNLAAAQAARLLGDAAQARAHLQACAAERRDFEWHHLALALDGSLRTLHQLPVPCTALAVSAAGRIAFGAEDGRIGLWPADPDGPPDQLAPPGGQAVASLAFDAAGTELFATDRGGDLRVFHVAPAALARQRPRAQAQERLRLPDPVGRLLIDAGGGRIDQLDPRTFRAVGTSRLPLALWSSRESWLPGDSGIASAGIRTVTIVDGDGAIAASLPLPRSVQLLAATPDLQHVLAHADGTLWSWRRPEAEARAFDLGARSPTAAAFLAGSARFAIVDARGGVLLVDHDQGRVRRSLHGHRGGVLAIAALPGGDRFVTGGQDGAIRQWSWQCELERIELLGVGEGRGLAITAAGQLLTGGADALARCLDPITGAVLWTAPHAHWVNAVAATPDVVITSMGAALFFWHPATGRPLGPHLPLPGASMAARMAVDQAGRMLAVAGRSGEVTFVDLAARAVVRQVAAHDGTIAELVHDAARARFLSAGADGRVLAFAAAAPTAAGTPLVTAAAPVLALAVTDADLFTSEARPVGGALCERDPGTGALRRQVAVDDPPVVLRPLGPRRLLAGTSRGHLTFWDREQLTPLLDLPQFGDTVRNIVAAPDGSWLAAIGIGGAPRILHRDRIADGGRLAERMRLAVLRDEVHAALAQQLWPPAVAREIGARTDLDDRWRAAALALIPPRNRWALAAAGHAFASDPAACSRDPGHLRQLWANLSEALDDDVDQHGLYTRCSYALVAVRLGEEQRALDAVAAMPIDRSLGPDDGEGWFLPTLCVIRGLAHLRLGDRDAALAQRDDLAALVAGRFATDRQAWRFLRELDDALR